MILRDLINNEQGKAYIVNKQTCKINELECAIVNRTDLREKYCLNAWYADDNFNLLFFAKNGKNSYGYRAVKEYGYTYFFNLTNADLDKTSYLLCEKYFITTSQEEAYDFVIKNLRYKIKTVNKYFLKFKQSFNRLGNEVNEYKTLKDLRDNKDGKAYMVHATSLSKITKINCILGTPNKLSIGYHVYNLPYYGNNLYLIRLSEKSGNMINFSTDCWYMTNIPIKKECVGQNMVEYHNYHIFLSKQDAYEFGCKRILERKQKIYNEITKILEKKFNINKNNGE